MVQYIAVAGFGSQNKGSLCGRVTILLDSLCSLCWAATVYSKHCSAMLAEPRPKQKFLDASCTHLPLKSIRFKPDNFTSAVGLLLSSCNHHSALS